MSAVTLHFLSHRNKAEPSERFRIQEEERQHESAPRTDFHFSSPGWFSCSSISLWSGFIFFCISSVFASDELLCFAFCVIFHYFCAYFFLSWSFSVVVLHLYLKKCWEKNKLVFFLYIKVKKNHEKNTATATHKYTLLSGLAYSLALPCVLPHITTGGFPHIGK